jgi:hypothetical protein
MRAKLAQEKLIKESGIPYSIVKATQFFEFVPKIADGFGAAVLWPTRLPAYASPASFRGPSQG